ncbi:MAG TPA: DUF1302 family protein [Vicinamibacterales bacterium]|nr:DUF1302 family protein [Vicinamibacterales bacterium]
MIAWIAAATLAAQLGTGRQVSQPPAQAATAAPSGEAFSIDGHLSFSGDVLPVVDVAEFRPQLMLDVRGGLRGETFRYRVQAIFEALVRHRGASAEHVRLRGASAEQVADPGTPITGAIARLRDAWIQAAGARGDLRAGYGRVIWGRLDEIQPSDVINPIDASRFLFDGRSEARLPVAFVRGRFFVREDLTIEGVLAPVFERGRFDELEEPSSPFNLVRDVSIPALPGSVAGASPTALELRRIEPARTWSSMSGGARVSGTLGRLDISGSVYRGFESFGLITIDSDGPPLLPDSPALTLVERYPRFTMIAGDFETVRGEWALRGEAAWFVDKRLAGLTRLDGVPGRAFDAGVGVDRRSGDYRVFVSAIVHREWSRRDQTLTKADLNLVGSIDRDIARGRYFLRGFAVANPADSSAFARALFVWRVRDDVSVEGSAAAFLGTSDDTLGRFQDRDFLLTKIRYRW